jgi:hypothetical protein
MMRIGITGASHFVGRMFEACGPYQWARELLKNALEAGATRVVFGVERQGAERQGVHRRTVSDNGCGMGPDELLRYFSTLGTGAKTIGGLHDNFGLGAKIACLPWNPDGVVVVSYRGGRGAMIRIRLEPGSGEYELAEFEADGEKSCVVEPRVIDGIDWSAVRPTWLRGHGTVVTLLGSRQHPDTALGNPRADEKDLNGLSAYLDTRFWDLTEADVRVVELRGVQRADRRRSAAEQDRARRPVTRRIRGASGRLKDARMSHAHGVVRLDEGRVTAEWYLRPDDGHGDGAGDGFIAARYNGELYHVAADKARFRCFGVVESQVQGRVNIVVEP